MRAPPALAVALAGSWLRWMAVARYVVLPDGTRVGRMDHCFKDMVSVREAQIHQAQLGEITVRIVRGRNIGTMMRRKSLPKSASA